MNKKNSKRLLNNQEIIQLSEGKEFVPIYDQKIVHYGGKQRWFEKEFYQKRGCGTIAAANIVYYMSKHVPGCESLYTKENLSKENFIYLMYEILPFIKPSLIGVPTVRSLGKGMIEYARSKGVNLKANYKSWKTDSSEFIKSGLKIDSPVAMLQYYRKVGYNWHWQTITKYYKDNITHEEYVETSNWGRQYSFNLKPFKGNKFVYFTLK